MFMVMAIALWQFWQGAFFNFCLNQDVQDLRIYRILMFMVMAIALWQFCPGAFFNFCLNQDVQDLRIYRILNFPM
ncbi:hypothetical protein IQ237_15070 [Sphaerospermopsis sp. LEGE 08334]|nr:hypothetical protein [Sphaerospermopsis sp. LEGE 08334]